MPCQWLTTFLCLLIVWVPASGAARPSLQHNAQKATTEVEYGHALLRYWHFQPNITYFQHGSYGVSPKPVLEAAAAYAQIAESNPNEWVGSDNGIDSVPT